MLYRWFVFGDGGRVRFASMSIEFSRYFALANSVFGDLCKNIQTSIPPVSPLIRGGTRLLFKVPVFKGDARGISA
jgi:hypothetical protein